MSCAIEHGIIFRRDAFSAAHLVRILMRYQRGYQAFQAQRLPRDQVRFTALRGAVRAACLIVAAISRRYAALTDPIGSVDTKS